MLACALLLALATQSVPGGARARCFEIRDELGSPTLTAQASEIAEAAARTALARLGAEGHLAVLAGRVRLYRDFAAFRSATRDMSVDAPDARGFAHRDSRTAHIAGPSCTREVLRERGLPRETRHLIAHEVAHLACFDVLPWLTDLPGWMVEGLADSVAHETLQSLHRARSFVEEPHSATQIGLVQERLARAELPRFGELLFDRLGRLGFEERYAARWLMLEFLRECQPIACQRLFELAFATEPRALAGERTRAALANEWTAEELEAMDARFVAWVRALAPEWRTIHGSFAYEGEALSTLAWPDADALMLRAEPFTALPFTLEGTLRIHAGARPQLHVVLAHDPALFHELAFTAESGVTFWRYEPSRGRREYGRSDEQDWVDLARADLPVLALDRDLAFRIEVDEQGLKVVLGGEVVLRVTIPGDQLLGRWGLGARAGACGEWRSLTRTQGQ